MGYVLAVLAGLLIGLGVRIGRDYPSAGGLIGAVGVAALGVLCLYRAIRDYR